MKILYRQIPSCICCPYSNPSNADGTFWCRNAVRNFNSHDLSQSNPFPPECPLNNEEDSIVMKAIRGYPVEPVVAERKAEG
jgi:hypothetical protein